VNNDLVMTWRELVIGTNTNSRGILALGGTSEVKPQEPRDRVANFLRGNLKLCAPESEASGHVVRQNVHVFRPAELGQSHYLLCI